MDKNFEIALRNLEAATDKLFEAVMYRSNFITDDEQFKKLYNGVHMLSENITAVLCGAEGAIAIMCGGTVDEDDVPVVDLLVQLDILKEQHKLEHEYAVFRDAVAAVIAAY